MSISTALLGVLTITVLALMLVLSVVWRRLGDLSSQLSGLPGKQLPANAAGSADHVEPVAHFPLITDTAVTGSSVTSAATGGAITGAARSESRDPDLTAARVASVTLAEPLIKVAAFAHGLRRALDEEQRIRISATFRRELRRQRKVRRRQASNRTRPEEARP